MPDSPVATGPFAIVAFEGWNDAADAATQSVGLLMEQWDAVEVASLDADRFYDFQVSRPMVSLDESGGRQLLWPNTRIYRTRTSATMPDIYLVRGIEPSTRWKEFCHELLGILGDKGVRTILCLGALLADVPHSRPIPVSVSSDHPEIFAALDAGVPTYEGPTGIIGVLSQFAADRNFGSLSLWAAVPHYVAQAPSPKAILALIHRVELATGCNIDVRELNDDAEAWERGVNELAQGEPDIAQYVQQLEAAKDTSELPEASGEAIAREFEQYLKRRETGRAKDDPGKAEYTPAGDGAPQDASPGEPTHDQPTDGAPGDGRPTDGAPGDDQPTDGAPGDGQPEQPR
ncbi:PAC2 family protein [Micrococcales bacterium 31B]|nr:PAC2 family protein [Micrococcales bacterium 31B]